MLFIIINLLFILHKLTRDIPTIKELIFIKENLMKKNKHLLKRNNLGLEIFNTINCNINVDKKHATTNMTESQ